MKSKTSFILWMILIGINPIFAQSLSPEVFANGGAHSSNNEPQLSWTIGETVTETFTNSGDQLTQGFHQTKLTITLVKDPEPDFELEIFPNPASEYLNLKWVHSMDQMDVQLVTLQGQVIREYPQIPGLQFSLDLSQVAQGPYYLRVVHREMGWAKTYKIQIMR